MREAQAGSERSECARTEVQAALFEDPPASADAECGLDPKSQAEGYQQRQGNAEQRKAEEARDEIQDSHDQ